MCWTWKTGTPVCNHFFGKAMPAPRGFDIFAQPIAWLPDGSGWVVQGKFVIDKTTGKELATLPAVPNEWGQGIKRLVGIDTLLVARQAGNRKTLELVPFDGKAGDEK